MRRHSSTLQPWYAALRAPPPPAAGCIHTAVARALARQPGRTLLVDESGQLTNGALLTAIDRRARLLLDHARRAGSPQHGTVAVRLENSIELVVSYFACLSAGLRYLPLPAYPRDTTVRLLEALEPALLVTSTSDDPGADGMATLRIDEALSDPPDVVLPRPQPRRDAHVLLTSGTESGVPKAVVTDHVGSMLSHRWRMRRWAFVAGDVVGCNIFGVWDVVPALLQGVPLVLLADATLRDPAALADAINRYGITRIMMTPTLLDACLTVAETRPALGRLRQITLCGEPVTAALVARLRESLRAVRIADLYSLSECHDVAAGELAPRVPTIRARVADFADVHVVTLQDPAALAVTGEIGRILVSGRALARGYLDEQVTARRFYEAPLGADGAPLRVYDTGDQGRMHDDGALEVLGRLDADVKVRGAWADPQAVTATLLRAPWVQRAVTVNDRDSRGHDRLRAFVIPATGAPADLESRLRAGLQQHLPPQSVPGTIRITSDLPLLPSGKIDTAKLLAQSSDTRSASHGGRSLQARVLAAFREVLERPDVGDGDEFADLGADSLTAIVLCGRIHALTGRSVRLQDLHRHRTPAELAAFLAGRRGEAALSHAPLPAAALPSAAGSRPGVVTTVLLTGATGSIGAAVLARLLSSTTLRVIALVRGADDRQALARAASGLPEAVPTDRLGVAAGDLERPRLGLSPAAFDRLVRDVDAVVHLGARVDMFAGYDALAAANVTGTRTALELALASGAGFHHLSSSAVLPLESGAWDESRYGSAMLEELAGRLTGSDGYSRTKLAAEFLVWQAAERGLEVTVTRIPHLLDGGAAARLPATLATLLDLGVLPEGPWCWQFVPVAAICDHVQRCLDGRLEAGPLYHLTCPPLDDAALQRACAARASTPARIALPALANVLAAAAAAPANTSGGGGRDGPTLATLAQLVREYGIRAALCLGEPELVSNRPLPGDPARMLLDLLTPERRVDP